MPDKTKRDWNNIDSCVCADLPQSAAETTSKSESGLPMAHRSSTRDQSDCVEAAAVEDYSFK